MTLDFTLDVSDIRQETFNAQSEIHAINQYDPIQSNNQSYYWLPSIFSRFKILIIFQSRAQEELNKHDLLRDDSCFSYHFLSLR